MSVCVTFRPFPMICMLLRGCVLRSKQVTYSRLIRLILNLLRLPIPPHRQGTALPRYNYTTLPKVFRVRQSQSLRGKRLSALPDPYPNHYPDQPSDTSFRSRVDQHDRRCAGANGPKAFRAADSVAAYPRRNDDFGPLYTSTKVGRDWN